MTKLDSLVMAVKVADNLRNFLMCNNPPGTHTHRRREFRRGQWGELEKSLESVSYPKIGLCVSDTMSWSDSAGDSIWFRTGDYYAVSYWTGEDMIFIYEVGKDEDLCESLSEREPVFFEKL